MRTGGIAHNGFEVSPGLPFGGLEHSEIGRENGSLREEFNDCCVADLPMRSSQPSRDLCAQRPALGGRPKTPLLVLGLRL